ncbi:phosphate butyryltransferase [Mangrovibacterium marinum]|uniref:Phosphate butyryltransferase n=1 Tax=Mangrovibacterium marinum TaxID=1639118 RepID=A0A2T5BX87_9BACT|nr:phosphate acyltransferase [Mangrovibacterium marinum]PTN04621.1 phosphate butyryltransferase [Mangrovibacterium marinum]
MMNKLDELLKAAQTGKRRRMVLVNGVDQHSLGAASRAVELGLVDVLVTGDEKQIRSSCSALGISGDRFELIPASGEEQAARLALELIAELKADCLMKGLISTDKYMRALLNKDYEMVGPEGLLSHVTVFENPHYHKLLFASDVAIIPYPDLKQKAVLLGYLIRTAQKFGIEKPKVALIAATEQVIPSIPACVDAAMLAKMADRGQIQGAFVDGPMGLDVAIDAESASIKKVQSVVAGDADCLLFPNIDAGNVFYKMSTKLCQSQQAAVVVGSKVPAVLSSRGDSVQTKLNSIALAALLS